MTALQRCDGNTYSNECAAHSSGVSVSMEGSCESSPGDSCEIDSTGGGTDTCTGPFFCKLKTGECNKRSAIHSGKCASLMAMCTMDMNEVCGCDGKTYPNECAAHTSGVSVSKTGP